MPCVDAKELRGAGPIAATFGWHELKRIETAALHPQLNCGLVRDVHFPSATEKTTRNRGPPGPRNHPNRPVDRQVETASNTLRNTAPP